MTDKKIKESLNKLSKALERLDPKDEVSKKKLSRLIDQVNRKLSGPKDKEHDRNLDSQINEALIHFKAQHPVIMEIIDEIKLALYSMGL